MPPNGQHFGTGQEKVAKNDKFNYVNRPGSWISRPPDRRGYRAAIEQKQIADPEDAARPVEVKIADQEAKRYRDPSTPASMTQVLYKLFLDNGTGRTRWCRPLPATVSAAHSVIRQSPSR